MEERLTSSKRVFPQGQAIVNPMLISPSTEQSILLAFLYTLRHSIAMDDGP